MIIINNRSNSNQKKSMINTPFLKT